MADLQEQNLACVLTLPYIHAVQNDCIWGDNWRW